MSTLYEESADWSDFRSQVLEFYHSSFTEEYMRSCEFADWGGLDEDPSAVLVLESDYCTIYRIQLVFCPVRREACVAVNGEPYLELSGAGLYCWLWHEECRLRREAVDHGDARWKKCQTWGLEQKARAEAAEAEVETLREALEPLVAIACVRDGDTGNELGCFCDESDCERCGELFAAGLAALKEET